jgi:hypothetical protein
MSDEQKVWLEVARPPTLQVRDDFSLEEFSVMELEERHELGGCCNFVCPDVTVNANCSCTDPNGVACVSNTSCSIDGFCIPINDGCATNECKDMNPECF